MKKKTLKSLILSALAATTFAFLPTADAAIQVNPIPNLSQDFIKGADVSMLPEMESLGAKFYDVDGTEMDELQIMKNHGINWIRVRIWNNPKDSYGGGGNTDEARARDDEARPCARPQSPRRFPLQRLLGRPGQAGHAEGMAGP